MVGAWRFELQTSCAQGRRTTENNRPVFNVPAETKQLSADPSMWLGVPKCAPLSVGWAQKLAQSRVLTTVRTYHIVNGKQQIHWETSTPSGDTNSRPLCLEAMQYKTLSAAMTTLAFSAPLSASIQDTRCEPQPFPE